MSSHSLVAVGAADWSDIRKPGVIQVLPSYLRNRGLLTDCPASHHYRGYLMIVADYEVCCLLPKDFQPTLPSLNYHRVRPCCYASHPRTAVRVLQAQIDAAVVGCEVCFRQALRSLPYSVCTSVSDSTLVQRHRLRLILFHLLVHLERMIHPNLLFHYQPPGQAVPEASGMDCEVALA